MRLEDLDVLASIDWKLIFFPQITAYCSGVGTQGSNQTLYYAEVKDEDRISSGGGKESEGEMIQVRFFFHLSVVGPRQLLRQLD